MLPKTARRSDEGTIESFLLPIVTTCADPLT